MGFRATRLMFGAVALVSLVGGCGSQSSFEFDALDLAPPHEELNEFPLGKYNIPIPLLDDREAKRPTLRNRFQLDFELYALVSPKHQSQLADAWGRHEGKIRDQVIRVCRDASINELQEPELSTLKARLMDALAVQMGDKEVRQLLITEVVSQEL